MSKLPPPLTDAQIRILENIRIFGDETGTIHFRKSEGSGAWRYHLALRDGGTSILAFISTNTVTALIRKNALVPEISDEEFEVQLALGTTDCRVYRLPGGNK